MSVEEIKELKSTLKNHASWIARLILNRKEDRGNDYILLAGFLRVLLCDPRVPVLIYFAKEKKIPLRIVNYPASIEKNPDLYKNSVFYLNHDSYLPHWDSLRTGKTIGIEKFLDQTIGVIGQSYTPRQIIKWVANKEGISHLDFKKPATFKSLKGLNYVSDDVKTEGFVIQGLIYSLARWTLISISFVLSPDKMFSNARDAFSKMNAVQPVNPKELDPIIHYILIHQSYYHTYFEGEHAIITECINHTFSNGLGIHSLLCILDHQLNPGKTFIYEVKIGELEKSGTISIALRNQQFLVCSFNYKMQELELIVDLKEKCIGIGNYFTLSFEAEFTNSLVKLSACINGENKFVKELEYYFPKSSRTILSQLIGGDYKPNSSASFFMTEFILCKKLLGNSRLKSLSNYLWLSLFNKHNRF